ncbi:MAG: hypothetical protein ACP5NX_03640 [Candidatus Bilamarchaeaceae archaeon]
METNNMIILAVAIALFAAAGFLSYQLLIPMAHLETGAGDAGAQEMYLRYLGFMSNRSAYSFTVVEDIDGFTYLKTYSSDGDAGSAIIKSSVLEREFYFTDDDTLLCASYGQKRECGSVKNNTELSFIVSVAKGGLLDADKGARELSIGKALVEKGGITFRNVHAKTEGTRNCTYFEYSADFANFSIAELERLGINPNSLNVQVSKKSKMSMCIADDGSPVYTRIEYMLEDIDRYTHDGYSYFDFSVKAVQIPKNATGDPQDLLVQGIKMENQVTKCLFTNKGNQDNLDICISSLAYETKNAGVCAFSSVKASDACVLRIAAETEDAKLCPTLKDSGNIDNCYVSIAGKTGDMALCRNIANETKKEICDGMGKK